MQQIELVRQWHEKYNVPVHHSPTTPLPERVALRKRLITEEWKEVQEAFEKEGLKQQCKELADLQYVVLGTIWEYGWEETFIAYCTEFGTGNKTMDIQEALDRVGEECRNLLLEGISISGLWSIFVLCNACFHALNVDGLRVFKAVQKSNMSKGENGKPLFREDGKILKGSDFQKPDLSFLDDLELTRDAEALSITANGF